MKKTVTALTILAALLLSLAGCGKAPAAEIEVTDGEPPAAELSQAPAEAAGQAAPAEAAGTAAPQPVRQDGERFETVISLEGMEETVRYEHIRSDTAGIEMDYDYESCVRRSEADRECFVSVWDDPANPENYLEVRYDPGSAEQVAEAIGASLSDEYEISRETREFEHTGSCIRIEASVIKNSNLMAEQLQTVYIIPAADGCRVATAHYSLEAAEGFGHRFAYMLDTLSLLER